MIKPIDTIHAILSDTHTGSIHALAFAGEWKGKNTLPLHPTSEQLKIRRHFEKYAIQVRDVRKNKRLKIIIDGDAIEGDHHHTDEIFTRDVMEMADLHIQIMKDFRKIVDWQRGDELYYTKGTRVHTGDMEDYIGKELGAVENGDLHAFELVDVETNGTISRFVHHGPSAGKGANEGNEMRNWLKNMYIENMKDGVRMPDVLVTGHVHQPIYAVVEARNKMVYKVLHGIILPSWQGKTRYANQAAPVAKNKIGGVYQEIKADGTICTPVFSVMGY